MKWFWKANYIITAYLNLIMLFLIPNGTELGTNKIFNLLESICTLNGVLYYISMIMEWIQVPLCIIVILLYKKGRTVKHILYIIILVLLNLIKWGLFFWATGSVAISPI